MARFAGYAKQKEPKWFKALVVISITTVSLIIIFGFTYVMSRMENEGERKSQSQALPAKQAKPSTTSTSTTTTTTIPIVNEIPNEDLSIEKIAFTSSINGGNKPADELESVSINETGKIYCYTRINSPNVPQSIHHVWVDPDGKVVADIKLNISNRPADTWSYISLYGIKPGKLQVQVKTAEGVIVAKRDLLVQ